MIAEAGTNKTLCSCSDHETWTEVKAVGTKRFVFVLSLFSDEFCTSTFQNNPNPKPFNTTLTKYQGTRTYISVKTPATGLFESFNCNVTPLPLVARALIPGVLLRVG